MNIPERLPKFEMCGLSILKVMSTKYFGRTLYMNCYFTPSQIIQNTRKNAFFKIIVCVMAVDKIKQKMILENVLLTKIHSESSHASITVNSAADTTAVC